MNIQHSIAERLSECISGEQDKTEEKILITYGIEVFLNEFFKFLVACVLGVIIGRLPLVLFETTYLLLMRRYTKELHFQNNTVCFIFTEMTIVLIPFIGINLHFSCIQLLVFFVTVGAILFAYVPQVKRIKAFLVYGVGFVLSWIGGGRQLAQATILVATVVALTTVKGKSQHC